MKRMLIAMVVTCSVAALAVAESERLKPYTLAGVQQGEIAAVQAHVADLISKKGFEVVGMYSPSQDDDLSVICVTHALLRENAASAGGLLGFSATLRLGLHKTESGVEVSYTTPGYWGNAYFRKAYPDVEADYDSIDELFRAALGDLDESLFTEYGSEKGHTAKKLRKYHYMMSMPYFDDVENLQKDLTYDDAVKRIEARAAERSDVSVVYAVKFPEQKMALYGIALNGEDGEKKFLPKIDFAEPRHVAFLPYEMLVLEDRTVMLHGKYRIALSFPDLTMGTFMKIMSTPGDIADAMRSLVEDED